MFKITLASQRLRYSCIPPSLCGVMRDVVALAHALGLNTSIFTNIETFPLSRTINFTLCYRVVILN